MKLKAMMVVGLVAAAAAADVPAELIWSLQNVTADDSGKVTANIAPDGEGVAEAFSLVPSSTTYVSADVGPKYVYADAISITPVSTLSQTLALNESGWATSGLRIPSAVSTLNLQGNWTLEVCMRINKGSAQWGRLIELCRAKGLSQDGKTPEDSFAFLLQQGTAATEDGSNIGLQMRLDRQEAGTRGDGFNDTNNGRGTVHTGEWFIYSTVYKANEKMEFYLNGELLGTKNLVGSLPIYFDGDAAEPLVIGKRGNVNVAYVRYVPQALSRGALAANTTLLNSQDEPISADNTHPRFWCRFETTDLMTPFSTAGVTSEYYPNFWKMGDMSFSKPVRPTSEIPDAKRQYLYAGTDMLAKSNISAADFSNNGVAHSYLTLRTTRAFTMGAFTVEFFFRDLGNAGQFVTILQRQRDSVSYTDPETSEVTTAYGMSSWIIGMGATGLRLRLDSVPTDGSVKPDNGKNWNQCVDGKTSVKDGAWHHVAMTYDPATRVARLYMDYKLDCSVTGAYDISGIPGDLIIGGNNVSGTNRLADYLIDEVRITPCILDATQFLKFHGTPATVFQIR